MVSKMRTVLKSHVKTRLRKQKKKIIDKSVLLSQAVLCFHVKKKKYPSSRDRLLYNYVGISWPISGRPFWDSGKWMNADSQGNQYHGWESYSYHHCYHSYRCHFFLSLLSSSLLLTFEERSHPPTLCFPVFILFAIFFVFTLLESKSLPSPSSSLDNFS